MQIVKPVRVILRPLLVSLLILVGVFILVTVVVVWYLADDFATPKRRAIQEYHQQILNDPKKEGIAISKYDCAKGQAPCLFVTADESGQFGKRGQLLQQQLQKDFHHSKVEFSKAEFSTKNLADTASQPKGVVVLLHGRHGRKEDLLPVAIRLVAGGFVCVLIDLPNHGDSPLVASRFGTELTADANLDIVNQSLLDVQNWLTSQNKQTSQTIQNSQATVHKRLPAFLWGMSMGGSYANYAMSKSAMANYQLGNQSSPQSSDSSKQMANWQGLIIVASLADMSELVDKQASHMLEPLPEWSRSTIKPMLLTMFSQFVKWQGGAVPNDIQPANVAHNIDVPILQFHGSQDKLIDISQGQKLHTSYASEDKTWITVDGAGHHNILTTDYPVYATTADWLLRHSE